MTRRMRLIRAKVSSYQGTAYFKNSITIPPKTLKELRWEEGEELEHEVEGRKLTIHPARKKREA